MRFIQKTPTQLIAYNSVFGTQLLCSLTIILISTSFLLPSSVDDYLNIQVCASVAIVWCLFTLSTSGKFITWIFDTADLSFTKKSRILFMTQTSQYDLGEIDNLQLESRSTGDDLESKAFGIKLLLKDGRQLHLCPGVNLSEYPAKESILRISGFLNL